MERRSKKRGREGEREREGKGQERRERREGDRVDEMERKRIEGRERKRGRGGERIGRQEGRKKQLNKKKCLTSLVVLSSHNLCHQCHPELLPPDVSF